MNRILLAVDGSEHTEKVIEKGLLVAEGLNAEVTVVTVVGEYVFSPRVSMQFSEDNWDKVNRQLREEAEEVVKKAAEPFRDKGLTVKTKTVVGHQAPADAICELAREGKFDLIVIGSRGLRGIQEMFLGSVSNKVAHMGCTSVLIAK